MALRKKHLPSRTFKSTPSFDSSLESPQLTIGILPGIYPLEILKQTLGFQTGVVFK
jgi:hypothetical protein